MYISVPEVVFILANSADPDEMHHYAAFHLVFTICQSTHLGSSSIQRLNDYNSYVW